MTELLERGLGVGDVIGPLHAGPVTRSTIALFAGGSGDHNEVHLDVDVARAGGMDDVFAQGMLSMAYLGRLVTEHFGQAAVRKLAGRFTSITPVGAVPVCTGTVTDVTDGLATIELTVAVGDVTTISGTARKGHRNCRIRMPLGLGGGQQR